MSDRDELCPNSESEAECVVVLHNTELEQSQRVKCNGSCKQCLYLWWRLKKLPVDKLSNISFLQLVYVSLVYYFIMRELLFNQG